jgi:ABC-type dipeptide/oligopeptide/nickel transport system permease subunit
LCIVGWGEVAQVVRQQVINIRPQLFIEAARSVGARTSRILAQHTMPSLLPLLIVLSVLEMGGILMLLAELGFLNIFLGGGFRVEIGEVGRMQPVVAYFSDIPEWGAMLAMCATGGAVILGWPGMPEWLSSSRSWASTWLVKG